MPPLRDGPPSVEAFEPSTLSHHDLELRCQWVEERLRQVLDAASAGYVAADAHGIVVDWNAEAERLFGWRRQEVIGCPLAETVLADPADLDALNQVANISRPGSGMGGERLRLAGRKQNGETFLLGLDAWPTRYGDSYTLNAFAYELVDDAAVRCEMGSLIESTGEPLIGTDLDGTICTWNHAAEETFGYPADEALGAPMWMLFPADSREELAPALDELRQGTPVEHHETVARRKDGSILDIALTVSLVRNAADAVTGYSVVARDVTEERRTSAELNASMHNLEGALAEAREAEARGRSFLADVAHQLRTPLAGIRASADTLLQRAVPGTSDRLLAGMVRETSRAARLVTSLLQISRLDEGRQVSPAPCDVVALCEDEARRAADLAPGLDVVVQVVERPAATVEVDAAAMREILANLLDNARRHATSRVEVSVGTAGDLVEVQVRDDGAGLPDDMVEQAFERFVSLDGQGGSGLGLPIARGLAVAHGGSLTYEEKAFVLRVPAQMSGTAT